MFFETELLFISNARNHHTVKINSENKPQGLYFSKALFEGFIFGGVYVWREIFHFKIDWACLILGRKFTIFLCFTLHLRAIFQYKPLEGAGGWRLIFGGAKKMEGILHLLTSLGGLTFGGAYTFQNFTVFNNIIILSNISLCLHYF